MYFILPLPCTLFQSSKSIKFGHRPYSSYEKNMYLITMYSIPLYLITAPRILVSFQGEEALLILFCFSGWINDFLCWGGFVPLSRISYIIYLMHFTVIWTFESVMIYPLDGTNLMMVILLHTGAKFHFLSKNSILPFKSN